MPKKYFWSSFDEELQCEEYYRRLYDGAFENIEVMNEEEEEEQEEEEVDETFEPGRPYVSIFELNP